MRAFAWSQTALGPPAAWSYDIRIAVKDDELDKPLDDMTAGLLFRAPRELLMNVIKHSRSPTAKVSLRCAWSRFEVTVEDAGVGFDPEDLNRPARGFGLLSAREQIGRLGGMVEVASTPGRGARIAISIPLRQGQSPSEESGVAAYGRPGVNHAATATNAAL